MNLLNSDFPGKAALLKPVIQPDIGTLRAIAESINDTSLLHSLNELTVKLVSNRFYLVIVGLFKRGKSSLINALTGKELAPVAVTPLTSVITFFEYGNETSAEVLFRDGERAAINLSEVVQYVSEEENPENIKQVQHLKICTPSPILEKVVLVDTPGLGSMFSHNSDTTLEFLPKIDAALFVLSADIPISKTDEEFLLQMKQSIPNVLFVLNKSDLLQPAELDKMIRYNLHALKKIFSSSHNGLELIPVSARNYFRETEGPHFPEQSNIGELRKKIDEQIVVDKDEILSAQSNRQLLAIADQLDTLLTVRSDTLQMPLNELEKKRESMQHSLDFLAFGKDDFHAVVQNRIRQLKEQVAEAAEQKRLELLNYCTILLKEESAQTWKEIKETDADTFYGKLSGQIIQQYEELKGKLEQSVKDEFSSILLQYSQQSKSFLNEIVKQMEEILGIQIGGIISAFDLDVYSSFYFKSEVKYTVRSIRKKFSYQILPDVLVKRMVLNQIYENCLELINPNAGRIRSDIDYKISESFRKFRYQFDQKLFDLLQSLKNMIEESIRSKQTVNEDIEAILTQIQLQKQRIKEIREQLAGKLAEKQMSGKI
jgi:small GTP-binding protein